jgi:hypothetical protein
MATQENTLGHFTVDQLRRYYTEAHDRTETNRGIALEIERELNKRGVFIDARQSYAEKRE